MVIYPVGELKQYTNQGSFQDAMAKMFWVSLEDKFQILIVLYFEMRI
jgi:hypothetical protein